MTMQTARTTLADILTNDALWSTFPFPPPIPQADSVVLEPDDPYIVSSNAKVSLDCRMRFRIRLYVRLMDNAANLDQLETLAARVRRLMVESLWNIGDLSQPQAVELDTGTLLTAYFPIEVLTEWPSE
jgi:hypothetical protein